MSRQIEMVDHLGPAERPDLFFLEDLGPRCMQWHRRGAVSLDTQASELRANRDSVGEAFSVLLRLLQKDLPECRKLHVRLRLEECMKEYAARGTFRVEPSALSFLASRADFLESAERMALALDAYLKNNEETIGSIAVRASRDVELERTNLTVVLSLPVREIDVMLGFRRRLCDYLDSVLSDEDKLRTTVSVTRTM